MATATDGKSPLPLKRLEQIATDACNSALGSAEFYEHPKTGQWNETIINRMLKDIISETTPEGSSTGPQYKFAINSTIVQHVVPNSQLNKPAVKTEGDEEKSAETKKGVAGRRGMHSATAGYWNEKTDGMWTFKFDGESKGLDVVIMVIWIHI